MPREMVDEICLVGPPAKIKHDLEAWRDSKVTTLVIGGTPDTLRTMAELVHG